MNHVGKLINQAIAFVEQVYIPDLMAIAGFYKDWAAIGGGLKNYLVYGDLLTKGYNYPEHFKFPRGAILDRNLNQVFEVNGRDENEIKEYIAHSWYSYNAGEQAGLHPWKGETEFNYTGPKPPYEQLNVESKYSWLKTPRWKDNPMEVGPLARLLVLMGDEGFGVRVVEVLAGEKLPKSVECLDGGTGSFLLLEPMQQAEKVILIDATIDGSPNGTVRRLQPRFSTDYPRTLTAHDIRLKDLLDAFYLLGESPNVTLYAISIPPFQEMNVELSDELKPVVPKVARMILSEISSV